MSDPEYIDEDRAVELQAEIEQILGEWMGMPQPVAAPMAQLIIKGMRERMGGRRVYIPAPRRLKEQRNQSAERDAEIAAMYNGRNLLEVMRAYGVSRRTVFNAVKRARARKTVQASA